jgi:hypothetical protein
MAKCNICNDRKEIEVIVMGTDTDWVECPYCKPSEEELERARKIKKIKKEMKLKHLNKEYISAKDFSLAFGISEKVAKWYLNNIATLFTMNKYYKYESNGHTHYSRTRPCSDCVKEFEVVYK